MDALQNNVQELLKLTHVYHPEFDPIFHKHIKIVSSGSVTQDYLKLTDVCHQDCIQDLIAKYLRDLKQIFFDELSVVLYLGYTHSFLK